MFNNILNPRNHLILLIIILLKSIPHYSQENKSVFEKMNLEFNIPSGYQISESNLDRNWCSENIMEPSAFRTLINYDKSILIGVFLNPPIPEEMVELIKKTNPDYTSELNFLTVVKKLIDTTSDSRVLVYDPGYLNKFLNADKGFRFGQKCVGIS